MSVPAADAATSAATSAAAAPSSRAHLVRVVLWMVGALTSFSVMAVSIRAVSHQLNIFEILSIRSGLGLLVLTLLALTRKDMRLGLVPRRLPLHALRNTIHFTAQYGWALSLTLLPLATVFALEFSAPVWTLLLAAVVLGERMTVSRIGSIVLGFIGVLVILRPGLASFQPASLLVLAAAFGFAIVFITTKKLTADVPTFSILFWMMLMQLPMGLAGSDPLFIFKLEAWQTFAVIGIGVAGLTSHLCLSNAFRAGDAVLVVPIDFLRIPLIAVVGWFLYSETIDVFVFVGAIIIVVGVLWNLWSESRRR